MKDPLRPNNDYLKKVPKPGIRRVERGGKMNVSLPRVAAWLALAVLGWIVVSHVLTALYVVARTVFFLGVIGFGLFAIFKAKKS